jgi:CubicO group peptidase (beta-lactamase class C family)
VTKLYLRFGYYWIALFTIFTLTVQAQQLAANQSEANWQENLKQIEKVLEKFKPESPGYQLSVSRNGKIVFSKAFGMANLEYNIRHRSGKRFQTVYGGGDFASRTTGQTFDAG